MKTRWITNNALPLLRQKKKLMCNAIALCNNCLFHSLQDPFVEITMCCQFKLLSNTSLRTARQGVGTKRTWRLCLQSISHTHLSGQPVKTCLITDAYLRYLRVFADDMADCLSLNTDFLEQEIKKTKKYIHVLTRTIHDRLWSVA